MSQMQFSCFFSEQTMLWRKCCHQLSSRFPTRMKEGNTSHESQWISMKRYNSVCHRQETRYYSKFYQNHSMLNSCTILNRTHSRCTGIRNLHGQGSRFYGIESPSSMIQLSSCPEFHTGYECFNVQRRNIFQKFIKSFTQQKSKDVQVTKTSPNSATTSDAEKNSSQVNLKREGSACGGNTQAGSVRNLRANQNATIELLNIKKIIAVASGKGGVGKSTVSTNLALAIAHKHGLRVGILDADVYGPSLHKMFNLNENSVQIDEKSNKLLPSSNYGIKVMSMGILTKSEEAAIWRGPMVMGALRQMLTQVDWGHLDVLVIDLPPGTGDAQLTLTQQLRLDGAVIVSTPQDIALIDVVRGINMFQVVNVPIIGIIENMSYYQCEDCMKLGKKRYIFGKSGAQNKAKEMDIPFLGEVPIQEIVPISCDEGKPVVVVNKESAAASSFFALSDQVIDFIKDRNLKKKTPTIVFED